MQELEESTTTMWCWETSVVWMIWGGRSLGGKSDVRKAQAAPLKRGQLDLYGGAVK